MFRRIKIIANPIAGHRKDRQKVFDWVCAYFSQRGVQIELALTTKKGDACGFAKSAVAEGFDAVVVIGGDGTVNEVGSGLVGCNVPMGIIPCGSGNGLARTLRIPAEIEAACELVSPNNVIRMDAGKANARYFFLVAGFGFDAEVGKKFETFGHRGPLPYFYLTAKEYLFYRPKSLDLEFNGTSLQISPFFVVVANGQQYGNNAIIAPGARVDDGLLDLCIVYPIPFYKMFEALSKLFKGNFEKFSRAELYQTQSLRVKRAAVDYMNLDGEAILEEPIVDIQVVPKALSVMAPPLTNDRKS